MPFTPYIPRNEEGRPVYQDIPRLIPIAPSAAVPSQAKQRALAPVNKNEGTSLTNQATGSFGLTSRYGRARDPNELIKAIVQLQELSPPGLNKQRKLVNAMEGGLGGILEAFKDSPASALNLQGVGAGIDQLFGTNTAQILQPTTHNLAMKIPELAEMVAKERSKYSQQEQNLLNQILSDFDTTATKGSDMESASYRQGVQTAKKEATMTPGQIENHERKARNYVMPLKKQARKSYKLFNELTGIINSYPLDDIPGVGSWKGSIPPEAARWIESDPKRKADFQRLRSLTTTLANTIKRDIEGARGSDQDFKVIKSTLELGFDKDPENFIKNVNKFIETARDSLTDVEDNLLPREVKYWDPKITESWQSIKATPMKTSVDQEADLENKVNKAILRKLEGK